MKDKKKQQLRQGHSTQPRREWNTPLLGEDRYSCGQQCHRRLDSLQLSWMTWNISPDGLDNPNRSYTKFTFYWHKGCVFKAASLLKLFFFCCFHYTRFISGPLYHFSTTAVENLDQAQLKREVNLPFLKILNIFRSVTNSELSTPGKALEELWCFSVLHISLMGETFMVYLLLGLPLEVTQVALLSYCLRYLLK